MHTNTTEIKRRGFLAGAMVLAPAAVMAKVNSRSMDPVVAAIAEHRAARAAFEAYPSVLEGDEQDKMNERRMHDAEHRVLTTKPISVAGVAAQLEFALEEELCGTDYVGGMDVGLDAQMFRRMIEALNSGALAGV